ncbi:hypothetical protein RIF29_24227 [Crotalaria pallida]|uniref:Uncharacterized protein n=1 Tax=Crotalaria pallida TaxID=3830 RepID=A0AAN9ELT9_CROPI
MTRTPCCEKMGMKKGPWTAEEDHILISHIQRYGHGNWRALPKLAGLLRCGKSCRLRWINYLRPDIKRGKFTKEEEDTILNLHEILGNRWSAIAARLPGRTDNEIKNFWHTHLKKRSEKSEVHNAMISTSYSLRLEALATSSSGALMTMPRGAANHASSAASSFNGKVLINASDDTSGEVIENHGSGQNQISEEMEFWYNIFIKSGQISQGLERKLI